MLIGVPTEIKTDEHRVGLRPVGAEVLVTDGHQVLVQAGCGLGSGFTDAAYQAAGAQVVGDAAEIWNRAEMIVKVKEPQPTEIEQIREGQYVFTYFHFAASKELTTGCLDRGCWAIAYETLTDKCRHLALLTPMSEVAANCRFRKVRSTSNDPSAARGVLLGGVPGVEPGHVLILGGGVGWYMCCMDGRRPRCGSRDARHQRRAPQTARRDDARQRSNDLLRPPGDSGATRLGGPRHRRRARTGCKSTQTRECGGPRAHATRVGRGRRRDRPGRVLRDRSGDHAPRSGLRRHGIVHYCVANMPGAVARTSTIASPTSRCPGFGRSPLTGPNHLPQATRTSPMR